MFSLTIYDVIIQKTMSPRKLGDDVVIKGLIIWRFSSRVEISTGHTELRKIAIM